MVKISVIIPTMAGREKLLEKLLNTIPRACEVIVVPDMDILLAAKRNKGAKKATGEYFLFIDDDNYLDDEAIGELLKIAEKSDNFGVIGLMACYDNNYLSVADGGSKRNDLTGFTKGINTNAYWPQISKEPYEVDEVANAFLIHSELFYSLNGFDEKNFPIDLDEADICRRIKNLGYKIIICPTARCFHKSQTYSRIADFRRPLNAYYMGRNKILYQRKHISFGLYVLYLLVFMPITILAYMFCLFYRKKPLMFFYFCKGIKDGLQQKMVCKQ